MPCRCYSIAAYLAVRGNLPGPFFRLSSGVPLSREILVKQMRTALQPSGVDMCRTTQATVFE